MVFLHIRTKRKTKYLTSGVEYFLDKHLFLSKFIGDCDSRMGGDWKTRWGGQEEWHWLWSPGSRAIRSSGSHVGLLMHQQPKA